MGRMEGLTRGIAVHPGAQVYDLRDPRFAGGAFPGSGWEQITRAFRAACDHARARGGGIVYFADGDWELDYTTAARVRAGSGNLVPRGCAVEGAGWNATTVRPRVRTDLSYRATHVLFACESETRLRLLRIDGRKEEFEAAYDALGATEDRRLAHFAGVSMTPAAEDVLVEDVWVDNLYGGYRAGGESFGVSGAPGCRRITYRRVRTTRIRGTGIHVSSWTYGTTDHARELTVRDCWTSDNEWHGISCFGARDFTVENLTCRRNRRSGLNVEWAFGEFHSPIVTDNGRTGLHVRGLSGVRLFGGVFTRNCNGWFWTGGGGSADGMRFRSEICFQAAAFGTARVTPPERAHAVYCEFHGTTVEPAISTEPAIVALEPGRRPYGGPTHHVLAVAAQPRTPPRRGEGGGRGVDYVLLSGSLPGRVLLDVEDPGSWRWRYGVQGEALSDRVLPKMLAYRGLREIRPVTVGRLQGWTRTNAAVVAYGGRGHEAPDAVTVSSRGPGRGRIAGPAVLRPGTRYLVRVRHRALDPGEWYLGLRSAAGARPSGTQDVLALSGGTADVGAWFVSEGVLETDRTAGFQLHLQYTANAGNAGRTSSIVIDRLHVAEVAGR
jgi:hypothetical protein